MSTQPPYNPMEAFFEAFAAGQKMSQAKKQHEAEEEERKLRMSHLKLQVDHEKLQSKMAARSHAESMYKFLEGLPGIRKSEAEPGIDVGGGMEVPGNMSSTEQAQVPEFQLPGVEEAGLPGMTLHPRTMEQVLADSMRQKRAELEMKHSEDAVDIPPQLQGQGDFPAGVGQLDKALLGHLPQRTRVPAGIYPAGHPLATGGDIDKDAGPLVQSAYSDQGQTTREREQGQTQRDVARIHAASAAQVAGTRRGAGPLDDDTKTRVSGVADRIASGELTVPQAMQVLGGVRSGLGLPLMDALNSRDSRIVPPKVREGLGGLATARSIIDQIEAQVAKVSEPGADQVQETLLLEGLTKSVASILSKKLYLETGRLTEQDVQRALGLVPGWKSANFAPGYAKKEINILREITDRVEKGLLDNSFRPLSRSGTGGAAAPAKAEEPIIHTYPSGKKAIFRNGQWEPYQ